MLQLWLGPTEWVLDFLDVVYDVLLVVWVRFVDRVFFVVLSRVRVSLILVV